METAAAHAPHRQACDKAPLTAARFSCQACLFAQAAAPTRRALHALLRRPKTAFACQSAVPSVRAPASHPEPGAATTFIPSVGSLCPAGRFPAARFPASWTASMECQAGLRKSRQPSRWPPLPFANRRLLLHPHHQPNGCVSRPPCQAIRETSTKTTAGKIRAAYPPPKAGRLNAGLGAPKTVKLIR